MRITGRLVLLNFTQNGDGTHSAKMQLENSHGKTWFVESSAADEFEGLINHVITVEGEYEVRPADVKVGKGRRVDRHVVTGARLIADHRELPETVILGSP